MTRPAGRGRPPTYNPHPGLMLVATAAERFPGRVAFVYPDRYPGAAGGSLPHRLLRAVRRLYEYWLLAFDIWGARRNQVIVVREFSTYYIWLTTIVCLPLMRKVALIVAHNVQRAHTSRLQRRLLVLLARIGTRLICVEDISGCLSILPPALHRSVVQMPLPVVPPHLPATARQSPRPGDPLIIGCVGDFRPEKRLLAAVQAMCRLDLAQDNLRVVVGSPHVEQTSSDLRSLGDQIRFFDTTSSADYFALLSTIHVLVVPYPAYSYRHRSSGLIADACGCATPVLATDLPALHAQVMSPEQGGLCVDEECFASDSCMQAALSQIRAHWPDYSAGMTANAQTRSVDAIASVIARLLPHEGPSAQTVQKKR